MNTFMTSGISFKFVHVNGHLKSAKVGSDGYWNKRADRAAKNARILGEEAFENGTVRQPDEILTNYSALPTLDDWRDRIQVPYVHAKQKEKSLPKKVTRHRKSNEDAYNICIRLNLKVKIR